MSFLSPAAYAGLRNPPCKALQACLISKRLFGGGFLPFPLTAFEVGIGMT
jgi:hypothetical protein